MARNSPPHLRSWALALGLSMLIETFMLLVQSVEGFIDLFWVPSRGQRHQTQPARILLSLLAFNSRNKRIYLREGVVEDVWPAMSVLD